jgi:hypothetical protein
VVVGEQGILKSCAVTDLWNQICLYMTRRGKPYVTKLLFDSDEFCGVVASVLERNRGKTLREVGDLELPLGGSALSKSIIMRRWLCDFSSR